MASVRAGGYVYGAYDGALRCDSRFALLGTGTQIQPLIINLRKKAFLCSKAGEMPFSYLLRTPLLACHHTATSRCDPTPARRDRCRARLPIARAPVFLPTQPAVVPSGSDNCCRRWRRRGPVAPPAT